MNLSMSAIPSGEAYMYPDATIVCGVPEMEDAHFDTLRNHKVFFCQGYYSAAGDL